MGTNSSKNIYNSPIGGKLICVKSGYHNDVRFCNNKLIVTNKYNTIAYNVKNYYHETEKINNITNLQNIIHIDGFSYILLNNQICDYPSLDPVDIPGINKSTFGIKKYDICEKIIKINNNHILAQINYNNFYCLFIICGGKTIGHIDCITKSTNFYVINGYIFLTYPHNIASDHKNNIEIYYVSDLSEFQYKCSKTIQSPSKIHCMAGSYIYASEKKRIVALYVKDHFGPIHIPSFDGVSAVSYTHLRAHET